MNIVKAIITVATIVVMLTASHLYAYLQLKLGITSFNDIAMVTPYDLLVIILMIDFIERRITSLFKKVEQKDK